MKRALRQVAGWPGIANLLRRKKRGPVVLFYHGVEGKVANPAVQNIHLDIADFEKQIAHLRKHFQIISLAELDDCLAGNRNLDPKCVVLTFDDGYRNNRTIVGPYLDSIDVPYSVFVSTRHIEEGLRFPTYYLRAALCHSSRSEVEIQGSVFKFATEEAKRASIRQISKTLKTASLPIVEDIVDSLKGLISKEQWLELDALYSSDAPMSWAELKELQGLGATIGSHCHDHFILHANQDPEEIERQLRISKSLIEQHLGQCDYIAYPNGGKDDVCASALEKVRQNGYRLGLTTVGGEIESCEHAFLLPRVAADTSDLDRFKFDLNLAYRHNDNYRRWAGA